MSTPFSANQLDVCGVGLTLFDVTLQVRWSLILFLEGGLNNVYFFAGKKKTMQVNVSECT